MPNWRLPTALKDAITTRAQELTLRTVQYARGDFPLTVAQVQAIILREDHCTTLRTLEREGMKNLPKHRTVALELRRDALPGLKRGLRLELALPEGVFVPRTNNFNASAQWETTTPWALLPDLTVLDDADRTALATWSNELVRQMRLGEMADATVALALRFAPTAYHVDQLWPGLRMLVQDRGMLERMRTSPRSKRAYAPRPHTVELLGKRIQAAEAILVGADMLEKYEHPEKTIAVTNQTWERLPGDPKFT